jgi:site-specific recombinase XerD
MKIPKEFEISVQDFTNRLELRGYSPRTLVNYTAGVSPFLKYLSQSGIKDLREVTSATVRNYQLELGRSEYSPWTVMLRLQAVRRFFDHLQSAHAILLNPCSGLRCGKVPDRLPKTVLTLEEARHLLETPDLQTAVGTRDRAILEVFYSSGLRLAEMSRLTLEDLDLRNGFLRVKHGKGAKDRVVPLGQSACQALRAYGEKVRKEWTSLGNAQKDLWLSSLRPHGPLKSQAIEVMVKRYGRLAGLSKRLTPHVWRHTCATHLVASGASIAYVQRLLGHCSLRTTQIYVRTSVPEIKAMHDQAHPRNQSNPI